MLKLTEITGISFIIGVATKWNEWHLVNII